MSIAQLALDKALPIPLNDGLVGEHASNLLRDMLTESPELGEITESALASMVLVCDGQPRNLELLHALASQVGAEQAITLTRTQWNDGQRAGGAPHRAGRRPTVSG